MCEQLLEARLVRLLVVIVGGFGRELGFDFLGIFQVVVIVVVRDVFYFLDFFFTFEFQLLAFLIRVKRWIPQDPRGVNPTRSSALIEG